MHLEVSCGLPTRAIFFPCQTPAFAGARRVPTVGGTTNALGIVFLTSRMRLKGADSAANCQWSTSVPHEQTTGLTPPEYCVRIARATQFDQYGFPGIWPCNVSGGPSPISSENIRHRARLLAGFRCKQRRSLVLCEGGLAARLWFRFRFSVDPDALPRAAAFRERFFS